MVTKYSKWLHNIANYYKIYQHFQIFNSKALQNLPKFGFFGLKIYVPSGIPGLEANPFPLATL
jgi:uncharacterized membrane protein